MHRTDSGRFWEEMSLLKKITYVGFTVFVCFAFCIFFFGCEDSTEEQYSKDTSKTQALCSTVSVLAEDYEANGSLKSASDATGIVYCVNENGGAYIITNYHVISTEEGIPCSDIRISPYGYDFDNGSVTAEVVGGLRSFDLAILYAENLKELSSAVIGVKLSDAQLCTGDNVFLTANALGRGISVLSGILSMDKEYVTYNFPYADSPCVLRQMRIDAAFYEGCSGGGVFDGSGNFCGLINSRLAFEGNAHIGYAIPISVLDPLCTPFIEAHKASLPSPQINTIHWGLNLKKNISDVVWNGLYPETQSTLDVIEIENGSLGSLFLNVGDRISALTINGKKLMVSDAYDMTELCYGICVGDSITVHYISSGTQESYSFTVNKAYIKSFN